MGYAETGPAVTIKKALRDRMHTRRMAQSPQEAKERAAVAQQALLRDAAWTWARQVALYMPTRGEMSTTLLLEDAWRSGKSVLLPRCHPRQLGHMDFVPCMGMEDLQTGRFNLLEPRPDLPALAWDEHEAESMGAGRQPLLHPDLVVMPGVAFDRQGNRLGFGGGYYDRALAHPAFVSTVRVGLAFSWQVINGLPAQLWDCPVHALCTDEGLLWL